MISSHMKGFLPFLCALLFCTSAVAANTPPPGAQNNVIINNGNGQYGAAVPGSGIVVSNGIIDTSSDISSFASAGVVRRTIQGFATNTVYAAGVTTYSGGTYTAPAGPQPVPSALAADQVFFVNFNQTNPGASNLIVAGLPVKSLKIVDSAGAVRTMLGSEIIPGPTTVYYDGSEFIYSVPLSAFAAPVTTATLATQADFVNQKTFYLTAGSETLTLPCANTLSTNGAIKVYSVSGTATIAKGSGCSDTLHKNGTTGTTLTIAQGDAFTQINTDGSANFYLSGGASASGVLAIANGGTGGTTLESTILRRTGNFGNAEIVSQSLATPGLGSNTLSNGTDTVVTYRTALYFPKYTYDMRFKFPNYNLTFGTLNQVGPGNAVTVEAALEYNGNYVPLTFNGQTSVSIPNGQEAISDVIFTDLPAGSTAYIRATPSVTSGQKWVMVGGTGTGSSFSNNGTDSTFGTGALTNPGNGNIAYTPTEIIGNTAPGTPGAVGGFGDSIFCGTGDLSDPRVSTLSLAGGLFERGLSANLNLTPPYSSVIACMGATTVSQATVPTTAPDVFRNISNLDYAITEWGTNDIYGGQTISAIEANLVTVWTMFSSRGIPVYQTTILPRNTSTDQWQTVTNQTPIGVAITGATNASPIAITTTTNHHLTTGQTLVIANVGGNTAANGSWTITVTGNTTLTLNGSTGNGSYTSGGTAYNFEANRISINTWIRTTPAPLTGFIETANAVEVNSSNTLTQNGGRWLLLNTSASVTGTASGSGTTTTLNDTTQTWTVNQWNGYQLFITGGTCSGGGGTIYSNTATQLTSFLLGCATDATSTYKIWRTPTTDGTHPLPPYYNLAAQPIVTWAAATVTGF